MSEIRTNTVLEELMNVIEVTVGSYVAALCVGAASQTLQWDLWIFNNVLAINTRQVSSLMYTQLSLIKRIVWRCAAVSNKFHLH